MSGEVAGRMFASGIGVPVWHEPCSATYDLTGAGWKRLKSTLGIEIDRKPQDMPPAEKDGTRVFFIVRGDGKELYRSPTLRRGDVNRAVQLDLDISGVRMIELQAANEVTWHNAATSVNCGDVRPEK